MPHRTTPEFRARRAAYARERRKDPAVRERERIAARQYNREKRRARDATPESRARKAAQQRERRKKPAVRDQNRAAVRKYYAENREKVLQAQRKRRPLAVLRERARREAKFVARAGRPRPQNCEVCGRSGRIDFDHCHQRNIFRGWLCLACNSILGYANDDSNILRQLAAYLDRTAKLVSPQLSLPGI